MICHLLFDLTSLLNALIMIRGILVPSNMIDALGSKNNFDKPQQLLMKSEICKHLYRHFNT